MKMKKEGFIKEERTFNVDNAGQGEAVNIQ